HHALHDAAPDRAPAARSRSAAARRGQSCLARECPTPRREGSPELSCGTPSADRWLAPDDRLRTRCRGIAAAPWCARFFQRRLHRAAQRLRRTLRVAPVAGAVCIQDALEIRDTVVMRVTVAFAQPRQARE